jgi:hypothetical protein
MPFSRVLPSVSAVQGGRTRGSRSKTVDAPTIKRLREQFKPVDSHLIVPVKDEAGVWRVRLRLHSYQKGVLSSTFALLMHETYYLDGSHTTVAIGNQITTERHPMAHPAAIPVRSKDVTDFGRLTQAASTLVGQMAKHDDENPPTNEQMEAFVMGYQGILEWQRKAQEQMTRAEGQIDMVAVTLRNLMGA